MRLRELTIQYGTVPGTPPGPRPILTCAREAARLIAPYLELSPVERFGVLSLDTKRRAIAWDVIAVGTLDATLVHPRDVFRCAILHNASAIIVAHNHPSGDPTASADDDAITTRLVRCGDVMGIAVMDHIIIGEQGAYSSARESGALLSPPLQPRKDNDQ
jgi:DNA repair protein RadC